VSAVEEPLSPGRLEEIRARAEAATAGPWGFFSGDDYAEVAAGYEQTGPGSYSFRQGIARLELESVWDDPELSGVGEEQAAELMAANAEFIAKARTDVPLLVAEVGWLAAELADARARVAELEGAPVLAPPIGSPMAAEQFFLAVQDGDTVTARTAGYVLHGLVHSIRPERTGCSLDNLGNARTYGLDQETAERREMRFTIHQRTGGAL
jgi:hypothetical protein